MNAQIMKWHISCIFKNKSYYFFVNSIKRVEGYMDKKTEKEKEKLPIKDLTTCEATGMMLEKARKEGVVITFDRATTMRACPIGKDSACCKHCAMGPCRLNAKDPYGKVGVCGATIDTVMARNFGRMIASGGAAHTDHGMVMLDIFREVVSGKITDYKITDTQKLFDVAASVGY
jgi:anaerobic carbon-monoxide dehydrogenase catalytic subunit